MITIRITELGNKQIGFYVLNENMELIKKVRGLKINHNKINDRLRQHYIKQGRKVACLDETV